MCTLSLDDLKSPLLKKFSVTKFIQSKLTLSSSVVQLKLKCLLKKPTHDDILEAKEFEPWHGISNNVVCATSKVSDQPAHMRSLIRSFASCLNIL